ncbi:hypothetical protein DNI29_05235 [Hymenobacter sediminis]|uniref:hypothetical protein n=1 Tax=Hymenobacter sediminis TaxID=2218621 RepID=UPI000DA68B58|nr:hypothetical protein [Hymenobacter sediminis]RPD50201.1 hypothetical protein DNI29_05235 [Hymenobacter sediminis]
MRAFLLFSPLLLAAACSSPTSDSASATATSATPDSVAEPMDTARPAAVDAQADTLLTARSRHVFSAPGSPDAFSLVMRGASVLTGEATFTITSASGQVIFREVLSAPDLEAAMVYEMKGPTATQAEREAYVRRRIQEFFADKNFRRPAVASSATFPDSTEAPAGTDRTAWDDLRRRPDAVAFQYLLGKEDRHTIAWSPLRKQVVRLP